MDTNNPFNAYVFRGYTQALLTAAKNGKYNRVKFAGAIIAGIILFLALLKGLGVF
jgi:hypothetical protein